MSFSLGLTWGLSSISGYGLYGLHIVLQALRRHADQIILAHRTGPLLIPPTLNAKLEPLLQQSKILMDFLDQKPDQILSFKHAILQPVGNNFAGMQGQGRIWGEPNIGCAAIEQKFCTDVGREVSKAYSKIIAISRWNEKFLRELNVGEVHLCYQGIETNLFYPAPSSGLFDDRFVIFSGGKFEFRKGQDIVIAAFKRFLAHHKEALLVTSWQSFSGVDPQPFAQVGHIQNVPEATPQGLKIEPWLLSQGLKSENFLALPFTTNTAMPTVLRDCDMAVFPNRAEGGTNLVAMETIACGIPTYVSANTGQQDLIDLFNCYAFKHQSPIITPPTFTSTEDWGETEVDEVLAAMEFVYANREAAKKAALLSAEKIRAFDWRIVNDKLLDVVTG